MADKHERRRGPRRQESTGDRQRPAQQFQNSTSLAPPIVGWAPMRWCKTRSDCMQGGLGTWSARAPGGRLVLGDPPSPQHAEDVQGSWSDRLIEKCCAGATDGMKRYFVSTGGQFYANMNG